MKSSPSDQQSEIALKEGDSIEVGVTHQIRIGSEQAWIKLGVTTKVQSYETADEALQRVSDLVTEKVIQVIEQTVDVVERYESR